MSSHQINDFTEHCDRCGLSKFEVMQSYLSACEPPDGSTLAVRRLAAAARMAPLAALVCETMENLGIADSIPPEFDGCRS